MSCLLTSGYTTPCADGISGVKSLRFTEIANKATLTEVAGVVTAFTLDTGKQFFKYELPKDTASLSQTINRSIQNGTMFMTQEVNMKLNKMQTTLRNEIKLLAQNNLMIIVEDNNGKYWLVGKNNGAELSAGSAMTGVAKGDMGGYDLTFTADEDNFAVEVTAGLLATLDAPAV